jgi:triosephosphate isomerase (TIM)
MDQSYKPTIITGNWKMHKTIAEALQFIEILKPLVAHSSSKVYLAVPFTALAAVAQAVKDSPIIVGAQNMCHVPDGPLTGEISGNMLREAGAQFVILGHSERRRLFQETNALINLKLHQALTVGLQPTVCVGESLEEREELQTEKVLETQLRESLYSLTRDQASNIIVAYEPIWAIGTGYAATAKIIEEIHQYCRNIFTSLWGEKTATKIVLQYGGSVKSDNASQLLALKNVDGLLVGGASLDAKTFTKIVNANPFLSLC